LVTNGASRKKHAGRGGGSKGEKRRKKIRTEDGKKKMERKADRKELTFEQLAVISRTTSFNIQKFYMVLTMCLSVLYGLLPCKTLSDWSCITNVESVYSAVRTQCLYKTDKFRLYRVKTKSWVCNYFY
jgi:hypothetical protein